MLTDPEHCPCAADAPIPAPRLVGRVRAAKRAHRMARLITWVIAASCCNAWAQTNLTFGTVGGASGNVPPPYLAAGTLMSGTTPGQPWTPITTDGWGSLSSVGAMSSYDAIGGQGLTISAGTQSVTVLAVAKNKNRISSLR